MVYDGNDPAYRSARWPLWAIASFVGLIGAMIYVAYHAMRGESVWGIAPGWATTAAVAIWLAAMVFLSIVRRRSEARR